MRNQGQGHIRQRGQRRWELKFDLGRDAVTGKRISRYVNFPRTKREAQAELNRLLNSRNEGTYVDPTKMTVAEYLEHWFAVYVDRQLAAKTAARHRGIVQHQIIPRLGLAPMRKLTAVHIEAFEADLQKEGYVKGRQRGQSLANRFACPPHPLTSVGPCCQNWSAVQEPGRASEATETTEP